MALQPRAVSPAKARVKPLPADPTVPALRSIALTLVITFALSFGYLYRKQRAHELPAAPPPVVSRPVRALPPPSAMVAPPSPPPAPMPARPVERAPSIPQPAMPAAQDSDDADGQPSEEPVPVQLILRRIRGTDGMIGNIRNRSGKRLTLTIYSTNQNGSETSHTMLVLDPLEKKIIGGDEGIQLQIQSNDRVVVQSEGYKDQESSAP
jgi:hypothetical protein